MKPNAEPTCKVCKQIRMFLLFAVPILMLIGTRPDIAVPSIPIEFIFTNFIFIGFIAVVAWRIYADYWKGRKK
ncbi:MAG: hypothetical protein P8J22_03935 [Pseudomonadales bacterium]|jgi:hypothetical protein|nr:hypothetical protein [Pseudomonadales bacterium]|tara:strand:+ start:402 stop:620 length:219 start_codon:yes stop_codon:yes gene_type:complete